MNAIGSWARRGAALLLLVVGLVTVLAATACSGNPGVSVGGSIHRNSSGNWGHSLSVGIHSNGRRW